ncbi:MAG: DUF3443 family protein [Actinomycetes bacterium]
MGILSTIPSRLLVTLGASCLFSLGLGACTSTTPFASTALDGISIKLAMPLINSTRPLLTADVSVAGGPAVPVLVDTGSPGLRIFQGAVGTSGIEMGSDAVNVTFADGTMFNGVQAEATVSIGGVATSSPIAIQVVQSASCSPANPSCIGANGLDSLAKVQHFSGILGIGLGSGAIFSPLMQLAGGPPSSFTIKASPSTGSGTLALNTTPTAPVATFQMARGQDLVLPNGVPAWASDLTTACWAFNKAAPACVPTSFDSGSPYLFASPSIPGAPPNGQVPKGRTVSLYPVGEGGGAGTQAAWTSSAGTTAGLNQMVIQEMPTSGTAINTGIAIFTTVGITFDASRGQVILG